MATETFANLPSTTVSSGGTDAPAGGTSQSWTVAASTSFPGASTGATQFHISDPAQPTEIIAVTNVSGTTWTVTRGAESTTPVAHTAGFTVKQIVTAGTLGTLMQKLAPTAVKNGAYNAVPGDFVPCDTSSAGFTVTLPTAPADQSVIGIKMVIQASTNAVTIAAGGSDVFNKASGATTLTLSLLNQGVLLQYKATGAIWYVMADDLALSQLDARYAQVANNLSDLASASTARTNLGLGNVATRSVAAVASFTPANPNTTTSTSRVMMGLGATCTYTPTGTGKVLSAITALGYVLTANVAGSVSVLYGTGTAPANGAAETGTPIGAFPSSVRCPASGVTAVTNVVAVSVLSLTPSTTYWFDMSLATTNGADAWGLSNVAMSFSELPS